MTTEINKVVIRVASNSAAEAYRSYYQRAHANGYEWAIREQQKVKSTLDRCKGGSPDEWLAAQSAIERALVEISGNHPRVEVVIELTRLEA